MSIQFYKRAIQCLDAKIGLVSNNNKIIADKRFFESTRVESLLTAFNSVAEVPYRYVDAEMYVLDDPALKLNVSVGEGACYCSGDFRTLETECEDIRYSLFGNLGLFFRYTLATLEKYHGIYSFHASSLYIPSNNTLLLVVGGPGAGKTVYLLKGIIEGWKIFSTEMTHLRITNNGVEFYKGSLLDNIRLGTLVYDFPEAIDKLHLQIPEVKNVWDHKIAVDLSALEAGDVYFNPKVQIINVRIESNRQKAEVFEIKDRDKIVLSLYQNASEKFAHPWLLYEKLPVAGFSNEMMTNKRLETMRTFIEKADMYPVKSIFAGIESCMEGVIV